MRSRDKWAWIGLAALGSPLPALILVALLALVLATNPAQLARQLAEPGPREAMLVSLRTSLISLALVVGCGLALAWVGLRAPRGVRSVLDLVVTLPALLPPSVAGLALLLAFGRQGWLGPWLGSLGLAVAYTPVAVVMAQVLVSTPFFVREATNGFQTIEPDLIHAARLDGAGPAQLAWCVTLPLAAPFFATGATLAWARALGEFGATILFAGNLQGRTQTMPLAIYLGFQTSLEEAKSLAVLLLVFAVAALVATRAVFGRRLDVVR